MQCLSLGPCTPHFVECGDFPVKSGAFAELWHVWSKCGTFSRSVARLARSVVCLVEVWCVWLKCGVFGKKCCNMPPHKSRGKPQKYGTCCYQKVGLKFSTNCCILFEVRMYHVVIVLGI